MNPEQDERFVLAVERIAAVAKEWLSIQCPPKREVTDATVSHIKTEEDEILEDQGYERGELGRWLDIGLRERAFEESARPTGVQARSIRSRTDEVPD